MGCLAFGRLGCCFFLLLGSVIVGQVGCWLVARLDCCISWVLVCWVIGLLGCWVVWFVAVLSLGVWLLGSRFVESLGCSAVG